MPKSKRDKKIALTKTQKKFGLEGKQVSNHYHSGFTVYLWNTHSLIAALIKSPWWKILSFFCLYKIKTCEIAVCNKLLLWNEIIVYHFTIVHRFVYYGEMKSSQTLNHNHTSSFFLSTKCSETNRASFPWA